MLQRMVSDMGRSVSQIIAAEKEIYPEPIKSKRRHHYKEAFKHNSTLVVGTHFLKALLSPTILALPMAFYQGGIWFSSVGFLLILGLVAFNIKRIVESAAYLAEREEVPVRTYDDVAYVSFASCSPKTKKFAQFFRNLVIILFFITYLDACSIFMIFMSRNLDALLVHYFPNIFIDFRHILFFQVLLLMFVATIRDLRFIAPFSFVACLLLLTVVAITISCFFIPNLPSITERIAVGSFTTIIRFIATVLFALSGISLAVTLKSSMIHPEHFFGWYGVYPVCLTIMCIVYSTFGFLGYWQFGDKTAASAMLNLPPNQILAVVVKLLAVSAVFLTSPLVFYVAFNVLWNNYLKPFVHPMNTASAEFFVRYCLIIISFALGILLPDLGPMIVLKGALFHSQLEVGIPAILDYVTYYPLHKHGRYYWRLIKLIVITTFGVFVTIGGAMAATRDLITSPLIFNNITIKFFSGH